jgi:hypothetical protein
MDGRRILQRDRLRPCYAVEDRGYETPCWIWQGAINSHLGYGKQGNEYAHVLAWETVFGPVPKGWHVHHRCETKSCIRPDHLEAMDPRNHRAVHLKYDPELLEKVRRTGGSTRQIALRTGISKSHVAYLRRSTH